MRPPHFKASEDRTSASVARNRPEVVCAERGLARLAVLARSSAIALIAGVVPSLALAQTYTTDPNFTINDHSTVYDGIGTVTPLPGGTSVLERVLHAVEQLNLSSPGAMAPVNGIYANIAESVLDRQWYSTERTEVAYEDYQEDVVTPMSAPIDFSLFTDFPDPANETITLEDGTTVNILDVPIGTIRVWELQWTLLGEGNPSPTTLSTAYFDGATEFTLTPRNFGQWFAPPSTASAVYPKFFRINADGNLEIFDTNVSVPFGAREIAEIAIVVEIDGEQFTFDTVGNASGSLDTTAVPYAGYDFLADYYGSASRPTGVATVPRWSNLALSLEGGTPAFVFSDTAPADTVYLDYQWEEIVTTDFTRQLNSFYDDWWQRDVPTEIDGSVTNIISGVGAVTEAATAAAVTARSFTLPTIDIGDIATTALGAVNTGDITVGVNSAVDEAAASTARAIQASLTVVGGSADTGTMMLNIAHNTSIIRGNVDNTLIAVNGSVGDISTTALGAVNTGSITNGVNAAVQGIVGLSGVN